jgi:hypothetical protein
MSSIGKRVACVRDRQGSSLAGFHGSPSSETAGNSWSQPRGNLELFPRGAMADRGLTSSRAQAGEAGEAGEAVEKRRGAEVFSGARYRAIPRTMALGRVKARGTARNRPSRSSPGSRRGRYLAGGSRPEPRRSATARSSRRISHSALASLTSVVVADDEAEVDRELAGSVLRGEARARHITSSSLPLCLYLARAQGPRRELAYPRCPKPFAHTYYYSLRKVLESWKSSWASGWTYVFP